MQLLQLLKNSPREVKRAHFVIYWVPPGPPPQEMELMGPGGEGPSRSPPPPGFSSHEYYVNNNRALAFSIHTKYLLWARRRIQLMFVNVVSLVYLIILQ